MSPARGTDYEKTDRHVHMKTNRHAKGQIEIEMLPDRKRGRNRENDKNRGI